METIFKTQTVTEEISLVDVDVHEEIHKRYTSALAQSMHDTRNALLRKLLDDAPLFGNNHEIEVNFDGKE